MLLNPAEKNPIKIADWIELQTLYSASEVFSLEELRSNIDIDGTLIDEEETTKKLPYELSEELVASTEIEIGRRTQILQRAYPFILSNGILQISIDLNFIPYIFCLLVADREFYIQGDQQSSRLFEHLASIAAAKYLGGESVRFGAPRDTMPKGVNDALDELARLTGNRKMKNGYPTNADDRDLGLDVAAWKNFSDQYWNKMELYMQCTTAQEWELKKHDCDLDEWRGIIYWPFCPIKALAIPYVLAEDEWKREACGVLLMDRLRIASVLEGEELPDAKFHWWEWCQERVKEGNQKPQ
jgi:hypothetical protein